MKKLTYASVVLAALLSLITEAAAENKKETTNLITTQAKSTATEAAPVRPERPGIRPVPVIPESKADNKADSIQAKSTATEAAPVRPVRPGIRPVPVIPERPERPGIRPVPVAPRK